MTALTFVRKCNGGMKNVQWPMTNELRKVKFPADSETTADGILNYCPALRRRGGKLFQRRAFAFQDDGFDAGDEHLGFGGQMSGDVVVDLGLVAVEEFLDGAFAIVVGGEGETPIVEMGEKEFQVLRRGGG